MNAGIYAFSFLLKETKDSSVSSKNRSAKTMSTLDSPSKHQHSTDERVSKFQLKQIKFKEDPTPQELLKELKMLHQNWS